ncbi:proteolipid protein DM beta-like isoform X3 [Varroa jacobsoni]|uniref:Neuronal membrane glycoprotein M6-b n=1 Tax=Varroa destructor TaxID=109461 RepID=A0A7M7JSB5_VARDE|nr:proteolipid protein DM beta-like isoform X3 [Varroa destructor]XP_022690121.1 proteolipid protein DM beta-like isoform X3 [Varroa jacobsoni]
MRKTVFLRRQQQRIQPLREATNWEEVNETSFWSLKDQPNVDPSERQRGLGCCCGCMGRMPFATLIATLMCCAGVGVFLFAMHRGLTATIKMFEVVFQYRMLGTTHVRLQDLQVGFIAVGAGMGMLALLILLIGCLSTGSTRTSVYKDWKARAGGRFTCIFLMTFTYLLKLTWIFICVSMAIISFVFFCWTGMCNRLKPTNLDLNKQCIDLRQFDFLLPEVSREHQNICNEGKKKEFCHDYVESASLMYYIATGAAVVVLISLIHYLMCLSANYTRIKDQAKIADLQILKELDENEMGPLGAKGNVSRY